MKKSEVSQAHLKKRDKALKMLADGRPFVAISINKDGTLRHHQFTMSDEEVIMALESLKFCMLREMY